MLNPLKYFTIRDICTTDLIFYNKDKEKELIDFCRRNYISYLPGRDRKSCHHLVEDSFQKVSPIPKELTCQPEYLIFRKSTINRFANKENPDEVMFVTDHGVIYGVVHIVDYNNDKIYIELYKMLLSFENELRRLLLENYVVNDDIVSWMKRQGDTTEHYKKRYMEVSSESGQNKIKNANPLQSFYLNDLLWFARDNGYLILEDYNIKTITKIRNRIAHAQDFIRERIDDEGLATQYPIYDIGGLRTFSYEVESFITSYNELMLVLDDLEYKRRN